MPTLTRRKFLEWSLGGSIVPAFSLAQVTGNHNVAPDVKPNVASADNWILAWQNADSKDFPGTLDLRRFKDPMYVLLGDVRWIPPQDAQALHPVRVPRGFVTDFASVPRPFWSLFRPDGNYAFAAVVHDYLYWEQDRTREEADAIFRSAMDDLKITNSQAKKLYQAVHQFGQRAWDENAAAKRAGERRTLVVLPPRSDITWAEWKVRKGVFG